MAKKANKAPADPRLLQQVMQRAIAAHQEGRLDEAERAYAQVLKALPDQPDALNLSGLIAYQQGKAARAVMLLKKAVKAKPDMADAHNHLGMAQRKLGQTMEALNAFATAVRLDPRQAEAQNNLGNARKDTGDLEGAVEAYRAAIALAPRATEPRYNLGNALRDLERHDEAIAAYEEVLKLAPNQIEARFNLAGLFERKHDLERAAREVGEVLAINPGMAQAILLKAKVLRRQKRLGAAEAMLSQLDGIKMPPDDAINLAFERGRLLDALSQYDKAFAAFAEGNRLQAESGGKKLMREAEQFRADIAATTAWLDAAEDWVPDEGRAGEGLVFLVGFPRSGTTLLDQVLDAHPQVQVMEERPAVTALLAEARKQRIANPQGFAALDENAVEALLAAYFAEADRHVQRTPDRLLIDKMPLNIVHVVPLARLFPKARYILALRHPLDVVLSNFTQAYRLNGAMANFLDLETAAETYDLVLTLWQKARAKLGLEVHEVRYEALVRDLESEARGALEFLGLDWDPAVLDTAGHARERKVINTPSYEQVAEPVHTRSSGRWRRYEAQLAPVVERLRGWVERLGY